MLGKFVFGFDADELLLVLVSVDVGELVSTVGAGLLKDSVFPRGNTVAGRCEEGAVVAVVVAAVVFDVFPVGRRESISALANTDPKK